MTTTFNAELQTWSHTKSDIELTDSALYTLAHRMKGNDSLCVIEENQGCLTLGELSIYWNLNDYNPANAPLYSLSFD